MNGDFANDYKDIKEKFTKLKAEQEYVKSSLEKTLLELEDQKQILDDSLAARVIIQEVAEQTQKNLEEHIANLVTLCMNSVFPEESEFGVEFVQKRGKTEAIFYVLKNGNRIYDLLDSDGGGLGDIISFALRIAFWKLDKKARPVFILDEPFKYLHSVDYQDKTSDMIRMLSKDLGIQMIIVSDQDDIIGDKLFKVVNGRVSES